MLALHITHTLLTSPDVFVGGVSREVFLITVLDREGRPATQNDNLVGEVANPRLPAID
jgi:hypothetical protein